MTADDEGFTVVELMLAVSILGIILAAISSSLLVFFDNAAHTSERDDHSAGASLAVTYLHRDLASASAATTGGTACSGTGNVISLSWNEWTATDALPTPREGTEFVSAYALRPQPGTTPARYQLERWYCAGSAAAERVVLLTDLGGTAELAPSGTAGCTSPSTAVVLALESYEDDSTTDYSLAGCLNGRLR